jgi:hypothetical protein
MIESAAIRRPSQHGLRLPATEMQVQRASMPCGAQPLHAGERLPPDEGLESRLDWHWIDAHGEKYGLRRPIPGPDPAHVQPRSKWHEIAVALRNARIKHQETQASEEESAEIGKPVKSNGQT